VHTFTGATSQFPVSLPTRDQKRSMFTPGGKLEKYDHPGAPASSTIIDLGNIKVRARQLSQSDPTAFSCKYPTSLWGNVQTTRQVRVAFDGERAKTGNDIWGSREAKVAGHRPSPARRRSPRERPGFSEPQNRVFRTPESRRERDSFFQERSTKSETLPTAPTPVTPTPVAPSRTKLEATSESPKLANKRPANVHRLLCALEPVNR